ncbi:MAG: membrane-bound lytic murein transglycosylase MltF [Rhodocyclaceae bacterium]|nr:membrane-bound lytic murein transglycosylase MltF [Rhodocyclaceae bacterium]
MARLFVRLLFAAFPILLLAACSRLPPPEESGALVVAIRSGPSSYQDESGAEASGFEKDMVDAFAKSLGLKVTYLVAGDQEELRDLLRQGKAHFAADAWIDDKGEFEFTAPLRESKQIVVGHADELTLSDPPPDLAGTTVSATVGSPQAAVLAAMAGTPPRFSLTLRHHTAEFDLLQDVADKKVQFASTDMLQYNLALHFLPDLEIALELPGKIGFGWAFFAEDKGLRQKADDFIATARKDGTLARLHDRYFGHIARLKSQDIAEFLQEIQTTLPRYRQEFRNAQASSGIDWRLLAAIAYQESKWDPLATSPTWVRGMMMLTEDTADRLGVSNRLDPAQSIRAGAKYVAMLRDQLPDEVKEPDRTWLALAAYNLGMGHLNGARHFAVGMGRDPNAWYEMKSVLPLLARPEYYSRLKSGRARGGEAVILVENIRTYYGILVRQEPAAYPMFSMQ